MSILVYVENWDGKFKKLSFELISYAYELGQKSGSDVIALSIGEVSDSELSGLGKYGASKVYSVNSSKIKHLENKVFTNIIAQLAQKTNCHTIILAHNNQGKALAPRLSVKLKAGLVTAVVSVPDSISPFIIKKKVFSGKALSQIKVNSEKRVLTLSQNSFGIRENAKNIYTEIYEPEINTLDFSLVVNEVSKAGGKILLTDAEIVVSGGRGMKGPENWASIEELAEILGGATACSRPVSDEGWRPHSEHTGQTGKIISPNLYFACGISGAIQHVAGISSSKIIVAINKDNEAPIFEVADYGIVGDVLKVIPEIVEAVKKMKAEN